MPDRIAPTNRVAWTPVLDRAAYEAFVLAGHLAAVITAIEQLTGVRINLDIAERAVGRHALRIGTAADPRTITAAERIRSLRTARTARGPRSAAEAIPVSTASIDRIFGIELEFNRGGWSGYGREAQRDAVVAAMIASGHAAYNHNGYAPHDVPTQWKMTTDVTVSGGEFVSPPISGEAGLLQVRDACRAIKDPANGNGAAGRNQGVHVHHDVRDLDQAAMRRVVTNLQHAETAFMEFVPRYRYDGSGSCRGRQQSAYQYDAYRADVDRGFLLWTTARRSMRDHYNRYVSFNMSAVLVQGSVEFRLLGNTLNSLKMRAWIRLGQAFMAFAKAGGELTATTSLSELLALLVAGDHLSEGEARSVTRHAFVNRSNQRRVA